MTTERTELRGSLNDVGVVPDRPLDKHTAAPAGSEFMTRTSWVPRVMLAHPDGRSPDRDASSITIDKFFINFVFLFMLI